MLGNWPAGGWRAGPGGYGEAGWGASAERGHADVWSDLGLGPLAAPGVGGPRLGEAEGWWGWDVMAPSSRRLEGGVGAAPRVVLRRPILPLPEHIQVELQVWGRRGPWPQVWQAEVSPAGSSWGQGKI